MNTRARAAWRGFWGGFTTAAVLAALWTAGWFAESFGWPASVAINAAGATAFGLLWAVACAFRSNAADERWTWQRTTDGLAASDARGVEVLRLTPQSISGRDRSGGCLSLDWEVIEQADVVVGRDVMGPFGRSYWREFLSVYLPVSSHAPVSVRFVIRGEAFVQTLLLSNGSMAIQAQETDRLGELVGEMARTGAAAERSETINVWRRRLKTE